MVTLSVQPAALTPMLEVVIIASHWTTRWLLGKTNGSGARNAMGSHTLVPHLLDRARQKEIMTMAVAATIPF